MHTPGCDCIKVLVLLEMVKVAAGGDHCLRTTGGQQARLAAVKAASSAFWCETHRTAVQHMGPADPFAPAQPCCPTPPAACQASAPGRHRSAAEAAAAAGIRRGPATQPGPAEWARGMRPEQQREWLVDCYRMRVDDDYAWGGEATTNKHCTCFNLSISNGCQSRHMALICANDF